MKGSFRLFALAAMLSLAWAGTAGAQLLAWWPFDEGAGTTAHDASGNGNDVTFVGNVAWTDGRLDGALLFDGSGDRLESPTGPAWAVTGDVSMSAWINLTAVGRDQKVGGNQNNSTGGFKMGIYSNNLLEFEIRSSANAATHTRNATGGTALAANVWYHVAGVYSQSEGYIRTYVNGVLDREQITTAVMGASTGPMRIGCEPYNVGANNFSGIIDDLRLYHRALTEAELPAIMAGSGLGLAKDPVPEDGGTDVPRSTALRWTAGKYARTHDVYFGTSYDDVNDAGRADPRGVLASADQAAMTYEPQALLDFGRTYYWRIDEVNDAPDDTIFKGDVWSFTTEPYGYPITGITATSSPSSGNMGPQLTLDGSGLRADDQHSTDLTHMWMASGPLPVWIQYEFDKEYKLHELWVWNSNQLIEGFLGFGAKDVTVEYSTDGTTWTALEGVPQFAQATGTETYTANTTVDLGGVIAKYVRLTITSNWGITTQASLSEVRFFYVPVQARQPNPADAETGVTVDTALSWRPGREAASHKVYFGTDRQAIADGAALADTVAESSYTPDELVFGNIYYWKVTEVNEAEAVAEWEGNVWTFTTEEYGAIDDFESYDDEDNRIFDTWVDGWVNKTGSQVGYIESPFAEKTIVNGGVQSMPLLYNNMSSPFYSEASRTWDADQDWTANDADTLKLFFRGTGLTATAAEPLYMTVEDSSGKITVVTHPDPNAILSASWQAWAIPLSTFTSAGMNLAKVKTMYLGVGNRTSPSAGGSGTIYIDDISRGTPLIRHVKGAVTAPGDVVRGVPNDGDWPAAETPVLAFDDNITTKFLHFKGEIQPTGVQVTPSVGATIVTELTFTTANDAVARDPVTFELYGSNSSIDGPYTLIAGGDIVDFARSTAWPRRTQTATPITFDNDVAYRHYQILFPTVRDPASANSMQIAEIELIGVQAD